MNLQTKNNQKGFTIVELLIVIVVIGILAAITIVAYNGIQKRANTSAAQSLANTVAKKAEAYNSIEGTYPTLTQLTSTTGPAEARLDNTSSASGTAPGTGNGTTVVQYVQCPASGTPTGGRIHYFDYTAGTGGQLTTPTATGNKSLTVGTGCV